MISENINCHNLLAINPDVVRNLYLYWLCNDITTATSYALSQKLESTVQKCVTNQASLVLETFFALVRSSASHNENITLILGFNLCSNLKI